MIYMQQESAGKKKEKLDYSSPIVRFLSTREVSWMNYLKNLFEVITISQTFAFPSVYLTVPEWEILNNVSVGKRERPTENPNRSEPGG